MTAQLVLDITWLFAPYDTRLLPWNTQPTAGATTRKHKRAENVPLSCLNSRPSGFPSFARIANLKISTLHKVANRRRLTLLELQSRVGDTPLKFQVICPPLSPKRVCGHKRVLNAVRREKKHHICEVFSSFREFSRRGVLGSRFLFYVWRVSIVSKRRFPPFHLVSYIPGIVLLNFRVSASNIAWLRKAAATLRVRAQVPGTINNLLL